jgi:hypothetical protein
MRLPTRNTALRYAAVVLLFSLAFAAIFPEITLHPGSRLAGSFADGSGSIRDYALESVQHRTPFTITHDGFNGAPEGTLRTPATTLAAAGLQTAFVWELRGVFGLVGAWNLFMFIGLVGTALAMFILLESLGCSFVPALFGSFVFGFGPYTLEHAYAGHLGLIQNWVFVLVVAAMIHLRKARSFGSGAIAGATIALAFYNSAYLGLFASVIALAFVVPELWRLRSRPDRIRSLALLSSIYYSALLFLTPVLFLYYQERAGVETGSGHGYADIFSLSARPTSYFLPSPRNPLFHWVSGIHPTDLMEQTLFYGFTTWFLAVAAVVLVRRRSTWFRSSDARWWTTISMIVLGVIGFVLSLPPAYRPHGIPIFMPSVILTAVTTYWRAYARFGVLVGLALATLSALALTTLSRRPGRAWRLLPVAALALVVVEFLPGNVGALDTNKRPTWVSWLASHPHGIVANYPIANNFNHVTMGLEDYWYQKFDHDPAFEILGARYYLFRTPAPSARLLAEQIRSPLTLRILAAEKVRYVVIHDDVYRAMGNRPPVPNPQLKLLARLGSIRIYAVPKLGGNVRTILRANQLLIAERQELTPPKITIVSGFGHLEPHDGSIGRRLAGEGKLDVKETSPKTVPPVKELRLTGIAANDGPPLLLRVEDSHGKVLARQAIQRGLVRLQTGPIDVPGGTKFRLTLVPALPTDPIRGTSSATSGLYVSHLKLVPLPDFVRDLG